VAIIVDIGRCHCLELIGRFGGNQIDGACRRVAATECALRTTQYFNLRNAVEFPFKKMIADERNIIECDGRIRRHRNRLCAASTQLNAGSEFLTILPQHGAVREQQMLMKRPEASKRPSGAAEKI